MTDWSMRSSCNSFEQQIRSQFNPIAIPNNNSSESSTTSSSTSWRQMKECQRLTTENPTKETQLSSSSFNLYKIFQQKSHVVQQHDTSKIPTEKSKSHLSTDQAIQTSIHIDSSSNSKYRTLVKPISSSSIHKSLPDLSFISQYSRALPSTSLSSINISRTTPSPTLIHQQKQDPDRPRTLKSIKRYKNSKHSTEPLGIFYSPQLRKTYAAIPTSVIKMKCPSSFSHQQTLNIKSCLPIPSLSITESANDMVKINELLV
jgi:hypothetical protein